MIWASLAVLLLPQKLRVSSKTAGGIVRVLSKEAPVLLTSAALLFPDLLPLVNAKNGVKLSAVSASHLMQRGLSLFEY